MIHFIGDIHGHATQLEELLEKLGYTKENGDYVHPSATAEARNASKGGTLV